MVFLIRKNDVKMTLKYRKNDVKMRNNGLIQPECCFGLGLPDGSFCDPVRYRCGVACMIMQYGDTHADTYCSFSGNLLQSAAAFCSLSWHTNCPVRLAWPGAPVPALAPPAPSKATSRPSRGARPSSPPAPAAA